MQPHVQGSATQVDLIKRTTTGPLRKWSDGSTLKIEPDWGRVMECKCSKLSPTNPQTMQRHNCMRQALGASKVCAVPREHAKG